MYLLAAKILAPILLLGALAWWHTDKVSDAFAAGKAEVLAQWHEADRIAKAVGDETSKLLKKGAAQNETELERRLASARDRAARLAAARADSDDQLVRLRIALDERAAAPAPSGDAAIASCPGDDIKLRSCEAIVSSGLRLASRARSVVDSSQELLERLDASLTALQEYTKIVETANDAP